MEPRGIRNNNPLNIRKGNTWKGERPVQKDRAFEEFVSMEYGIRAGFIILRKYITGYGGLTAKFNTIEKIIRRWAPPSENATQKYIDFVSQDMGIDSRVPLVFTKKALMVDLVYAMIFVECGQRVEKDVIASAYDMI